MIEFSYPTSMPTHEIRHQIEDLSIGEAEPIPSAELLEERLELDGKPVGTKWAISAKVNGPTDIANGQHLMRYRQGGTRWKTFGEVTVDRAPPSGGISTISTGDLRPPRPDWE
jgi:hypothetical protein